MIEKTKESARETTEALMDEKRFFGPLPQLVADANLNPVDY